MALLSLACDIRKDNPNLTLEEALQQAAPHIVATKHTVLTGGGLHISSALLERYLGPYLHSQNLTVAELFNLGTHVTHPGTFSTTNFLLRFAGRASAVSLAHALEEKQVHPHSHLIPITNGINCKRWQSPGLNSANLSELPDSQLWEIHQTNKIALLELLRQKTGQSLDPNILTVAWARRFTSYKRPELLFSNMDELTKMTQLFPATQFVIAGQTNPNDTDAQELAARLQKNLQDKQLSNRIIFLSEYHLDLAQKLTAGVDVWLNTPLPGLEASGTSGMKAGINGVLQFSTSDGWVKEVNWEGLGWLLPEQDISNQLYSILEQQIIPLYYKVDQNKLPEEWIGRLKKTIQVVEDHFTTTRVLNEYYEKLYFPNKPN